MAQETQELLDRISKSFSNNCKNDKALNAAYKAASGKDASYTDAAECADRVGEALAKAFGENLSSSVLTDGRLLYDDALQILEPMLTRVYNMNALTCEKVQETLNKAAGLHMKAQVPELNSDKVDGFARRIGREENFDDVKWILDEPVKTFSRSIVDDSIKANADFQYGAGLTPKIIRTAEANCCPWCSKLAGEYDYPLPDDEIYRRHNNCRCIVDYHPGDGRVQNVHTKQWTEPEPDDIINLRKQMRIPEVPSSIITRKVRDGSYSLKLSDQNYNKHVAGTMDYLRYEASRREKGFNPQSRLTISKQEAQEIINKKSGTGIVKTRRDGTPTDIEKVTCDGIVGQYCHQGKWYDTNKAIIAHSKHGSHIYPIKGNDYD